MPLPLTVCPGCNGRRWAKNALCVRCARRTDSDQFMRNLAVIDPDRARRIRKYQARAALGLPLFGRSDRMSTN